MSSYALSVVIPVFNRGEIIRYTLESVRRASVGISVETIIVDDGSIPPTAGILARMGEQPTQLIRQENQGLLFARLAGLARVKAPRVLFLDSDDLVGPDKFKQQLAAMEATGAVISYSDSARCELSGAYDALTIVPETPTPDTKDVAEFCISVQPPPHSPIFDTRWLQHVVTNAYFLPSELYNSVAEIWFYHNAAARNGRVVRVPGAHTIVGSHPGTRLTNHWEKLATASLAVMEAFARSCPVSPVTAKARRLVGDQAFLSWRRLPRNFSPAFSARELALWQKLGSHHSSQLGGKFFQLVARILGPENAARVFRRWQARPYSESRTMSDVEFSALLSALPPP